MRRCVVFMETSPIWPATAAPGLLSGMLRPFGPKNWVRQRLRDAARPQAEHSSNHGLSPLIGKSKVQKLIRFAFYYRLRPPLWPRRNSSVPPPRARTKGERREWSEACVAANRGAVHFAVI